MKRLFFIASVLLLIGKCLSAAWLADSIINDNNRRCRTGYNVARDIATNGNDIYTVWTEEYGYGIISLRAKISGSWTNSELVSEGSPGGIWGISANPSLALDGNNIYVVWEDYRTGAFDIFFRKYSGGWGNPTDISGDTANSRVPVITVTDAGKIFVIWQNNKTGIYQIYSKINSNGTWQTTEKISSTTFYAGFPSITHYGETIYAVWEEEENNGFEIYTSTYSGGNWSPPKKITNNPGMSQNPSICVDFSGRLHLVWMDNVNGNFRIYYSTFNGSNWSAPIPVTDNPGEALYPQIISDPYGIIHLVWSDNREGNYEIFHKSLVNGIWSEAENISQNSGLSTSPHIACTTDGCIHIIWYDWSPDSVFVSPQIRYRRFSPIMNALSNTIIQQITSSGVKFTAIKPPDGLNLYRQDKPFAIFIKHKIRNKTQYIWTDSLPPGKYSYILQQIAGTNVYYSNPIQVAIPDKKGLYDITISPNPFTTKTVIRYSLITLSKNSHLTSYPLQIYDVSGRLVKQFIIGNSQSMSITWNGKDSRGKSIKSGIYFVKLCTPDFIITRKIIKM